MKMILNLVFRLFYNQCLNIFSKGEILFGASCHVESRL